MKTYNYIKYALFILLTGFIFSCSDDAFLTGLGGNNGSVSVKLGFTVPAQSDVISSRAVNDYKVNNLYVFVCNADGKLIFKRYYRSEDLTNGTTGFQGAESWITAELPIGQVYIYAFANVEDAVYPGLKKELDEFKENETNVTDIKALKIAIGDNHRSLERIGDTWVMSGTCADEGQEYYTITKTTTEIKTIKLRRLDSMITFKISAGVGSKCETFKARRWYVVNAPANTYVIERKASQDSEYDNWDASNDAKDFYTTKKDEEYDMPEIINNSFSFYIPENRKLGKTRIENNSYQEREKQDKDSNGMNGAFSYAPENGTYVVIMGTYEGEADSETYGKGEKVVANVVYKIHLGYVGENANDFFSERNTKYTYNVTVRGVDNIVLEVEKNEEKNPGATGEVIFTKGDEIYTLDAHYETVLLTFKKSELTAKSKDAFRCITNTPFTTMSNVANCDQDWVKVIKNSKGDTALQKYPGDGSSELQSVQTMLDDLWIKSRAEGTDNTFFDGPDETVTYTCFVNEFYYDNVPEGVSGIETNEALWKYFVNKPNRLMYIVCKTDRSADGESSIVGAKYILSQRSIQTFYTTDLNNGLTYAYGIESLNETGDLSWGTPNIIPTDEKLGWNNTQKMVNGKTWNELISYGKNGYTSVDQNKKVNGSANYYSYIASQANGTYLNGMTNNYKKAYIACMQRNRNSAGSNEVRNDDLKWYLPAIKQYQSIYIGESGITAEAKLFEYPAENLKYVNGHWTGDIYFKHYASSTLDVAFSSPKILWAEEGASTSRLQQRNAWNSTYPGGQSYPAGRSYWSSDKVQYRCARNLGTVSEAYVDYAKRDGNIISFPYLNKNANTIRPAVNGELGEHYNDDPENRLYTAFEVSPTRGANLRLGDAIFGGHWSRINNNGNIYEAQSAHVNGQDGYTWHSISGRPNSGAGNQWRVPNLREITIMEYFGLLLESDAARTKYKYQHRKGWFYGGAKVTMGNNDYNEGYYIHWVRDCEN